ncbi:hypothetical protein J4429_03210 [Candidatus Pacearchaeota archaeon]|nr:hypothetical protein [Candidatus Pacearchaeota archaeon]
MVVSIELKNVDVLLKYVNCVERVLFVDNKWMKDYEDIKTNVRKEYTGIPLFLKKILDSFEAKNLSIFYESLPEKELIKKWDGSLFGVVLESLNHSNYVKEGLEDQQYVVIACPSIEKVFHFKTNKSVSDYFLKTAEIKDFYYHPQLPRIKIYSKNFSISENKSKLKELKFLYTLPLDANKLVGSYKEIDEKIFWDELVPDPAYGVQVGNLGVYYISPIKIVEVKRDIENIREQIILVAEDFFGKKYEFCMKPLDYKKILGDFPEEKVLDEPFYLRALTFQGFAEDFRHILESERISSEEFKKDSAFSYIRFRKVIKKEEVPQELTIFFSDIAEKDGAYYCFPYGFGTEMFDAKEKFNTEDRFSVSFAALKKYHEFQKLCDLHPDWKNIYLNKIDASSFYHPLKILYPNPWGVHRGFLRDSSYRFRFYAKNKLLNLFCPDCNKYSMIIKTKDIPERCPICNCKGLISLEEAEDKNLFLKDKQSFLDSEEIKLKDYYRLSTLFISFSKWIYYTLNFTKFSLNRCVEILNQTKSLLNEKNEEEFFDKLFKIKEHDNKRYDISNILYQIGKNEV